MTVLEYTATKNKGDSRWTVRSHVTKPSWGGKPHTFTNWVGEFDTEEEAKAERFRLQEMEKNRANSWNRRPA